jgi:cyanophycin synthetase
VTVDVLDSRRLTGANIHARSPGAVLEVRFGLADDVDGVLAKWRLRLAEALAALGWTADVHVRRFVDADARPGAELFFTAAIDQLYAATNVNEWALARATGELPHGRGAKRLVEIQRDAGIERAARRGALELIAEAEARGILWLIDDQQLSLGQYADAQVWPIGELPSVDAVDWTRLRRRPLALITGTNGKTTTTRLLARIVRTHGLHVGNTSTDGLCVDERLIEEGDWTGPGGARAMLRNPDIEVALLEAARGGLLRRGVGVPHADVAVITNVERDHLGEYGVFDLAGMAAAKGVIASVVDPSGRIVLGAESPALVEWARSYEFPAPIVWFAVDPDHPVVSEVLAAGGEVWTVVDGELVRREGTNTTSLCPVTAMPLSLGGVARHNVANALAAAAAARGLGIPDATITAALREFGAGPDDNPGRARIWTLARPSGPDVTILLDFAHNQAGIAVIVELVAGLFGSKRPAIGFGMAGDRTDDELRELATALTRFDPSFAILREQPHYMRGRQLGEVPALLEQGLLAGGLPAERIFRAADEPSTIEQAIERGAELIVMLVHTEHEAVATWLRAHAAKPYASV